MISVLEIFDPREMVSVWQVTYRAYLDRGLCTQSMSGKLRHCERWDHRETIRNPHTHVFLARDEQSNPIGTVSWTAEGPSGIPQDETYADLIDVFRERHPTIRFAGAWRIATAPEYRSECGRMALLKALIDACYRSMLLCGVRACFYSFHPRHARVYARMAGLHTISDVRQEESYGNADSVLMYGALPSWVWEQNA